MTETARLVIAVDSSDADRAERDLKKLGYQAGRVEGQTKKTRRATDQLSNSFGALRNVLIGVGAAFAVRQVIRAADTYTELNSRIKLVTDSARQQEKVYKDLLSVSQDTRSELEGTVTLYTRLKRSTSELQLADEELLTITKAINQSFVVSGASADEAANATRQLAQGLAAGALRGDEFNAVMEQSPRLSRAIAESMGVTIGELRDIAADGKITAEIIANSLIQQAGAIESEFGQMERTVGQAMTQLRNDFLDTFGRTDVQPFVNAIDELRLIVSDPNFKTSMVELGSAVATLVGWLAEGASEGVKFSKWLGEELASRVGGIADDDLPRLNGRLDELNRKLKKFQQFGATEEYIESTGLPKMIRDLEARIKTAQELRDTLTPSGGGRATDQVTGGGASQIAGTITGTGGSEEDEDKKQTEWEKQIERVRQQLMTEEEVIKDSYSRRRETILSNAEENKLTTDEKNELLLRAQREYQDEMTRLEEQGAEARTRISRQERQTQLSAISGILGDISSLMNSESRKQFEIGKKAAMAKAAINIPSAASNAYESASSVPFVGHILAPIAATAAIIAQGARLQSISQMSFDGGGGGTGGAGGGGIGASTPSVPQAPAPPGLDSGGGGNGLTINLNGNFSGLDEDQLAESMGRVLGEKMENKDFVLFSSTSRQARELQR